MDLNEYDEQKLINTGGALSLIMLIDKIRDAEGISSLSALPKDYMEELQAKLPPRIGKLLSDVITVLLKRINVPDNEIYDITGKIHEREVQKMFAWADNYDVQETRRVAREEGLREGREDGLNEGSAVKALAIAKNLMKMALPTDKIVEATGLTRAEVEGLRESD